MQRRMGGFTLLEMIVVLVIIGLIMGLVSDLMYVLIDPRIDFARREV